MNIQISKQLHTTISQPFYSDAKEAKNVSFFFFFLLLLLLFVILFISTRFLRNIADTNLINTPPKPFRPTDVPFVGYKTETRDLGEFLERLKTFASTKSADSNAVLANVGSPVFITTLKTRSSVICVCGNLKNLLWLLFLCHDIIYFFS